MLIELIKNNVQNMEDEYKIFGRFSKFNRKIYAQKRF